MLGVSPVAVQPLEPEAGVVLQPASVPGVWLKAYPVGAKGLVHASVAEVGVSEPTVSEGAASVPAWARA